jgi:hypothetical protein
MLIRDRGLARARTHWHAGPDPRHRAVFATLKFHYITYSASENNRASYGAIVTLQDRLGKLTEEHGGLLLIFDPSDSTELGTPNTDSMVSRAVNQSRIVRPKRRLAAGG